MPGSFQSPEVEVVLAASRVAPNDAARDRLLYCARRPLDWGRVQRLSGRSRISGLVYWNLQRFAESMIPRPALSEWKSCFEANALHNLRLTGVLLQIVRRLQAEGIRAIPFKGPTLAALAYGNVALREFGDLDLLVECSEFDRAADVLRACGFRPGLELSESCRKSYRRSLGQEPFVNERSELVELHDRLTPGGFRFELSPETFRGRLQTVSVLGQELATLPTEELLLFLSAHAAKHAWDSLAQVVDVAELLRSAPQLQWDRLRDAARQVRGERMLQLALLLARELLDAPVPEEMAAAPNRTVRQMADRIEERLLREEDVPQSVWERGWLHYKSRERRTDGAGYLFNLVLSPTYADWAHLDLPRQLSFLYYAVRPLRLVRKYSRQLLHLPRRRAVVVRERTAPAPATSAFSKEFSGT
jgi:Uncharacterised nucleotidyltransferase